MNIIFEEIFKALGYLFIAALVYFAWKQGHDNAKEGNLKMVLWEGLLWCAGIAFIASITVGKPTCIDSETDNRGTTCYEYADDGFEPTMEQRAAKFIYYMTLFYLPVVVGAYQGNKIRPVQTEDELLLRAKVLAISRGFASPGLFQKELKIPYHQAAVLIDELHDLGVISGPDGAKPRSLL